MAPDLSAEALHDIYAAHYSGGGQVRVRPLRVVGGKEGAGDRIEVDGLANTDFLDIHVYVNPSTHQALVVAQLDNLGKGACGAAIQNIGLMLGLDELG